MAAKVRKKTIKVDYLARVEGEAAIRVTIAGRETETVELRIWEPPRFFEGFLVGRSYHEVPDIVARICGICPVSHMTTAIRAIEKAMGVKPSPQTVLLRRLLSMSQILSSHIVHLYAFVFPDYEGYPGLPSMLERYPQVVERLLRVRSAVNDLTKLIGGGRALHPIGTVVGGFTRIASVRELRAARDALVKVRPDALETLKMVAEFEDLEFSSEREFMAIRNSESYAVNVGDLVSTGGLRCSEDDYYEHFSEYQVGYAMAKQTRRRVPLRIADCGSRPAKRQTPDPTSQIRNPKSQIRNPVMVGALARLNLKDDQLFPEARKAAEGVGFKIPDYNPFHNNVAQAIEIVHGIEDCIRMIESLDPKEEKPRVQVRAGEAGAITEAPRGLLHDWYAINRRGIVEKANIVTPTAHNFMSIEKDMKEMTEQLADRPSKEIRRWCEMLVRAYDPCFSCSVH